MKTRTRPIKTFYDLAFRAGTAVKLVNLVTIYRIIAFPVLVVLIFTNEYNWFRWLLAVSFFTDAIDGQLARRFNAFSILGSKLDSIGDDLTVTAAAIGMVYFKWDFFEAQLPAIAVVFLLFLIQTVYAWLKYGKPTAFHTYGAKIAAVLQGLFLLSLFFFDAIQFWLYDAAIIITALQLLEETVMIYLLPRWKNDIKGIYWAMKDKDQPPGDE